MHLVGVVDLSPERAKANMRFCGWDDERIGAKSLDGASKSGATCVTDDSAALLKHPAIDVIIEATGDPGYGIRHCLSAIENRKHVVMVNVEADVVAGPLLARYAREAGVVYSLAYGDQPALVCEHVDWARTCGFEVVCAGKGTRYHPTFHASTPETVWGHYGMSPEVAERGRLNPKMFNSFLDGTKSGIEMTAICNATGLLPQPDGLGFPPSSGPDLAKVCKPREKGGALAISGTTEVVSSLDRDLRPIPNHIQFGTYVVVAAGHDYVRYCAEEYQIHTDEAREFLALYRPTHWIGLELGVSVASAALRNEPTGAPFCFNADVVATTKRAIKAGEILDGEGGYCVWGKQQPAEASLREGWLPLGLAHNVKVKRDLAEGVNVRWSDVEIDATSDTVRFRRAMEEAFAAPESGKA